MTKLVSSKVQVGKDISSVRPDVLGIQTEKYGQIIYKFAASRQLFQYTDILAHPPSHCFQ